MMLAHTAWLSEDEKREIVDRAVDILGSVGMRFTGSSILPLLAGHGAQVDAGEVVRFPAALVEETLSRCPRSFVMAGVSSTHDVLLDEQESFHFCPSGCVAKTLDPDTGVVRPSTLEDVRRSTAILDEMSEMDLMWTQATANDVPLERRELLEYFTVLTETRKHVTFVDCPHEVDAVLRIVEVLGDGADDHRERPRLSTVVTAASPLQVDGAALDVHLALARHGVPIEIYSMGIAGVTAPVTLLGGVVLGVAEFLAVATAIQLASPGAKVIFCFGCGVLDMVQTTFSLGCVESSLMAVAATEVGHWLGVPVLCPAFSTDAKHPGVQTGYEKALKGLTVCSAGPDIVTGWGVLDAHNIMSLTQGVIDNEMARMVRRLSEPCEMPEASALLESVARVGPGGSFLGEKETARRIRAGEHLRPEVSDRRSYELWAASHTTELDTARERVDAALEAHRARGPVLTDDQIAGLIQICRPDEEQIRLARRV